MNEFEFKVTFTVEADDYQQASNSLHTALVRAMFPDDIEWQSPLFHARTLEELAAAKIRAGKDGAK